MKRCLLTLFGVLSSLYLFAQKIEVSAQANSGLFNYSGPSATASSTISQANDNSYYTNNPYGSKKAFSYGLGVQTQLVTGCGFIIGLQTGYDILRSKTDITGVYPNGVFFALPSYYNFNILSSSQATGATYLQDMFINLNPYIGYRFHYRKVRLDILPGADIAFNINSYDKGNATTIFYNGTNYNNSTTYQTDVKRPNAPTDIRLKMGLAAYYNKFGINASYARGLTNYEKNMIGDAGYDAKSRLIRFGISYRIL